VFAEHSKSFVEVSDSRDDLFVFALQVDLVGVVGYLAVQGPHEDADCVLNCLSLFEGSDCEAVDDDAGIV